jgi:hypothetical protein
MNCALVYPTIPHEGAMMEIKNEIRPYSPIFAVVIAKPSDTPVYTEELSFSSAVALRFPRLFIG